jgi:protein disulfide-isomerase A6
MSSLFLGTSALYGNYSDVIELTPSNFESRVIKSADVWIVKFFAPWCAHSKAMVPEYSKAATALKGIAKVGAVDATVHKSLGSRYGVREFPTIKIFGANKKSPSEYQGPKRAKGLIDAAFKEIRRVVDSKIGGGSGGTKSCGDSDSRSEGGQTADNMNVIELTDSNFKV